MRTPEVNTTHFVVELLEKDRALTLGQLARWGIRLEVPLRDPDAREVRFRQVELPRTARSRKVIPVTVVELRREAPLDERILPHVLGVAEVRRILWGSVDAWDASGASRMRAAVEVPDAVAVRGDGLWAVEYDTGAYTEAVVRRKCEAFGEGYAGQIWAVPAERRAAWLRRLGVPGPIVVAPWW